MKYVYSLIAIGLLFVATSLIKASITPAEALAHPERPAADSKYDLNRQPLKVLEFSEVKSGDVVLDLFSGGGYYTELLSKVVGNSGHIHSHNNKAYLRYLGKHLEKRYVDDRLSNVTRITAEANDLKFSENQFDKIYMVLTIHDFYHSSKFWPAIDTDKVLSNLYKSLKPGGIVLVIDHIGPDADRTKNSAELHRVFPAHAMNDMKKAGFQFITEADFLKNPDDPLTISMADKSIRGKTSRFVYKFTKAS